MRNTRHFLGRVGLRAKEAKIIRGFCRQFLWYDGEQKKRQKLIVNLVINVEVLVRIILSFIGKKTGSLLK